MKKIKKYSKQFKEWLVDTSKVELLMSVFTFVLLEKIIRSIGLLAEGNYLFKIVVGIIGLIIILYFWKQLLKDRD